MSYRRLSVVFLFCSVTSVFAADVDPVEDLLARMTLEEKAGQLNLVAALPSGPEYDSTMTAAKSGTLGGIFNPESLELIQKFQKAALQSRLRIPLIIGADIIHGHRTIFPAPLAESSSWDLSTARASARIAAVEGAAAGVHWTFAPMVDITRDPRWGRVLEGAGEDPYLGSAFARARVEGFQGTYKPGSTFKTDELIACFKHFAGYGAGEAGLEYNTVNLSEAVLRNSFFPPYEAAVKAGALTVMSSFNELLGRPASGSSYLFRNILRNEWGFKGMVVSDYKSIWEMAAHGYAKNDGGINASQLSLNAGIDMDMQGQTYTKFLPDLVRDGHVKSEYLDGAVRRVLRLKVALGLFEQPYRYINQRRFKAKILTKPHLDAARDAARKSIVLLKNASSAKSAPLLPLAKTPQKIALIGPAVVDSAGVTQREVFMGGWRGSGKPEETESLLEGLKAAAPSMEYLTANGTDWDSSDESGFKNALATARQADVIVAAMGEPYRMVGEAKSRTNIQLPGNQRKLLQKLAALKKPMVLVVFSGRPLDLSWEDKNIQSIVEAWHPGSRGTSALGELLFGDANFSAKLTMTFPRSAGQLPIYYNRQTTGRPQSGAIDEEYVSKYLDSPNSPLYPFGHGLSYTRYEYRNVRIDDVVTVGGRFDHARVSADVRNIGNRTGEEIVQLYVQDVVASNNRPSKELKGFAKVQIRPLDTAHVEFKVSREDLSFWGYDDDGRMGKRFEPGEFKVFVGPSSADADLTQQSSFFVSTEVQDVHAGR